MNIDELLKLALWPPSSKEKERLAWERARLALASAKAQGKISPKHPAVLACESGGFIAPRNDAKN